MSACSRKITREGGLKFCFSGVGFGAGVVASVILFRRVYISHRVSGSRTLNYGSLYSRTDVAHRPVYRIRRRSRMGRLRPLIQPRTHPRHTHHQPGRGRTRKQIETAWRHLGQREGQGDALGAHSRLYSMIDESPKLFNCAGKVDPFRVPELAWFACLHTPLSLREKAGLVSLRR